MITNTQISKAKSKEKTYTISDGGGLALAINHQGGKYWHMRCTVNGKRKLLSLGVYPAVSLQEAREKRDQYKKIIASGLDPVIEKKKEKLAQQEYTFEELLREWHQWHYKDKATTTSNKVIRHLERYIIPELGAYKVSDLTPPILLECLRKVEATEKLETTQRLKQYCGQAFRYGVGKGTNERDITQDLKGILKSKTATHHPTLTDPKEISQLLQDMETYKGSFIVKTALKLSPYVFVRPKELSLMKWADIDLEKKEWLAPADDMKMKVTHLVPLSKQAAKLLQDIKELTGAGKYVFANFSDPKKHMNSQSVNNALKKLGYKGKIVSHGFKSMASTLLNEHGFRYDVIEKQLAHEEKNTVRKAYNHAQYIKERTEMMNWWGDYLESLKNQDKIIPLHRQA